MEVSGRTVLCAPHVALTLIRTLTLTLTLTVHFCHSASILYNTMGFAIAVAYFSNSNVRDTVGDKMPACCR